LVVKRRVVLGRRLDGSLGLDIALPNYDAEFDDRNDATKFSFCSDWTDFVPLSAIGIATIMPATGTGFQSIPVINNGYLPFIELRKIEGARIFDDTFAGNFTGFNSLVTLGNLRVPQVSGASYTILYIVYKTPMDLQT
jgi:hypothetical protein